ncbi:MAG: histidine--tRNA ligase [Fimbriimonadales bacterium]|nr:histidine--tRNA ligase [Fimbriimonadales bacterium]
MRYQAPRGTQDILPAEAPYWVWMEERFREVCRLYGYEEIRTPIFEETDLFVRSLGEATEVVHKEMYTFEDRGGRSLTLKPEMTAPAVRAYLEHKLGSPEKVTRLFYISPIFRYERPQKGRFRQSHQCGVELLGSSEPDADAEVVDLAVRWYRQLGFPEVTVKINSLGMEECRQRYREALRAFVAPWIGELGEEVRERFERNPLRLLDSKEEKIQKRLREAPTIDEFWEEESREHYSALKELLKALGIPFEEDVRLVRGLDYYTKTVFEIQSGALGAQNALCGGGRYDHLIAALGGEETPAVGVAMGLERALLTLKAEGRLPPVSQPPALFAVCLTERRSEFWKVVSALREQGFAVVVDVRFGSAKAQFRQADKSGARFALIVGEDELKEGTVTLKDLSQGEQCRVTLRELPAKLKGEDS